MKKIILFVLCSSILTPVFAEKILVDVKNRSSQAIIVEKYDGGGDEVIIDPHQCTQEYFRQSSLVKAVSATDKTKILCIWRLDYWPHHPIYSLIYDPHAPYQCSISYKH